MDWTYHYIVADDERLIRTSLLKQINTFRNGDFVFSGEATDGLEALHIIERSTVDIVFSDVRMPRLDGLELSKQIAEQFPWIKVVLISGYSDFDYVRKALHYGVTDYLLKPIDPEKLTYSLNNVVEQLRIGEEKELSLLLALIESEEEPRRNQWKQYMLKQQPAEIVNEVIAVLSPRIRQFHNHRRLLRRLLSAWSERFMNKNGLSFSESYFHKTPDKFNWIDLRDWKKSVGDWIVQLCEELHHRPPATGHKVVSDVKKIIYARYAENLTLEDLAAATYLNRTYLAGLFKQSTGMTIGQFIQEVRMKQASLLLETTRNRIHEIAETVGYHDLSHFSKTFKQHFGVTPQAYRNMVGVPPDAGSIHDQKFTK